MGRALAALFVTGALAASARGGTPSPFTQEAAARGLVYTIENYPQNDGYLGYGCGFADFDNDGWEDVVVLGASTNRIGLFQNDGDGTFTDRSVSSMIPLLPQKSAFTAGDYDGDGDLDLYLTQWGIANYLMRNNGDFTFTNVTAAAGVSDVGGGKGASFGDLDGDGWLDFYLGTGYPDYEGLMPNVMYRNVAGRGFSDVTLAGGFGHLQKGHAVAFADYDHDGDQDVFEQMGGAFPGDRAANVLYRNPGFGSRWLAVELRGVRSNRSAIGARIRVDFLEAGRQRTVFRHVSSGGSFGANPLRQHLGLGRASRIERLEVHWPTSDLTQAFTEVQLDAFVRIVEGEDRIELRSELEG
jgi:hypothetical protein